MLIKVILLRGLGQGVSSVLQDKVKSPSRAGSLHVSSTFHCHPSARIHTGTVVPCGTSLTLVNGVPKSAFSGSSALPISTSASANRSVQSSLKLTVSLHHPSGQVSGVQTSGSGAVMAVSEHARQRLDTTRRCSNARSLCWS